jgi:2',3'-cyclic-nucleotide 2'-phosphodiesterase (5'-nucleotidase family)/predicted extracellular nuclease
MHKRFRQKLTLLFTIVALVFSSAAPFVNSTRAEETASLTVQQAIGTAYGTPATVEAYIVGYTISKTSFDFDAPFTSDTNVAIADSPEERDPAKLMPVQLPASVRTQFGLLGNPNALGKKVKVTGTVDAYFTIPGIKNLTAITFADGATDPGDGGGGEPAPIPNGPKTYEIQGAGHNSPYQNQVVEGVQGVVTHVIDSNNFYIQDPTGDNNPNTSDGLLVYKKAHGVRKGDLVAVNGTVKEWVLDGYPEKLETDLPVTEVNATAISIINNGQPLPASVVLGKDRLVPVSVIEDDSFSVFDPQDDAIDFYESLEGMIVALENPEVAGPQKYGEVPVLLNKQENKAYTKYGSPLLTETNANPERMHLFINKNFVAKAGDRFSGTVNGVVSYSFSNYKILTDSSSLPSLIPSEKKEEKVEFTKDEDKVSIASYNVENFSASTPDEKVTRIADSFINDLNSPDIIGLLEVQDNNGETNDGNTDASASYQKLIDKVKSLGGPDYSFTDIAPENNQDGGAPGGNIRVGYLYNPDRVKLKEAPKGTTAEAVSYVNNSLTRNPGRIEPLNPLFQDTRKSLAAQFVFKGQDVIVIANHLNSKGGDSPLFGRIQPVNLSSESKRIELAQVINSFVKDIIGKNPRANVVVLGDQNDFEFSKTLQALKGDVLSNLVESLPVNQRFTYNYQGNAQALDHMLVSGNLKEKTQFDIVNINSPYMDVHGRASDHDPLIAQFDLKNLPVNRDLNLTIMHTNDTHAHLENVARSITAVNQVRKETQNTLMLDAGDVFSGTLYFNKYLGQADLEFMNKMGYDAMTFGNHEFDKPSEILAEFIKNAAFPFVSSNIDFSKDPIFKGVLSEEITEQAENGNIYPALIKDVEGQKVGVIGLTTEDTTFLASPSEQISFNNATEKARTTIRTLNEKGVNKIIVLSHLGYFADQKLADEVQGIDIIVGGHTHTKLSQPDVHNLATEPTLVVQAGEYGNLLGRVDASFDENGKLTKWNGQLLDLLAKNESGEYVFPEDEWAKNRLAELSAPIEEMKKQIVGSTAVALDGERANIRTKETNLGNLIADAMLEKGKESVNATIALQNGGGIRASIDAGDISLNEVLTVMPFGNTLVTLDLTGEEVVQALEHSVASIETGAGQFMQVAGVRFKFDPTYPAGNRVYSVEIKTDSGYQQIDRAKTYTVATNAFVADGGDGYSMFKKAKDEGRINELFVVDYEVLNSYLNAHSPVSPNVEGRILMGSKDDQGTDPDDPKKECPDKHDDRGKHKGHDKQKGKKKPPKGKACGNPHK